MSDNQKNWNNYWQGRTGTDAGTALVGVENNQEINAFWTHRLTQLDRSSKALDLACGAGTVAKILCDLSFQDVNGVDISDSAIAILNDTLPNAKGTVGPLENLPFSDDSFDLVVSQFGFEYGALDDVVAEIARVLKTSGEFIALVHKKDGAIHEEVERKLTDMRALERTGYLAASREMFRAIFSSLGPERIKAIATDFRNKRIAVETMAQSHQGFARYLLDGTQDLFQRRGSLGLDPMLEWLSDMEHEMERFIGRMISMDAAALDEKAMFGIEENFVRLNVEPGPRNVLKDTRDKELGWIISARKK